LEPKSQRAASRNLIRALSHLTIAGLQPSSARHNAAVHSRYWLECDPKREGQ
jgi:hypothetical protein